MRTNNIGFYEDLTKIIIQLSSNMPLISSSVDLVRKSQDRFSYDTAYSDNGQNLPVGLIQDLLSFIPL